jgi:7-cyano-7-deazaguanosine (preQ0) biosynthesis protein QueE
MAATNVINGQKKMIDSNLKVSEIFYSLQGEGTNAGRPVVFLRTSHCNLACTWCDTKYTWDWDNYDYLTEVKEMSTEDLIISISRYQSRHLVITGGEPMIQQKQLLHLIRKVKEMGYFIEIETNGTILPDRYLNDLVDQWNVSPKLESSLIERSAREIEKCYLFFTNHSKCYFKYVINDSGDLQELQDVVKKYRIPTNRIILIPQGKDKNEIIARGKWLSEICKAKGYILSLRLQILLWSNRRGV